MRPVLVPCLVLLWGGGGCAAIAGLSEHTAWPSDAGVGGRDAEDAVADSAPVGADADDGAGDGAGDAAGADARVPCASNALKPIVAVASSADRPAGYAIDGDFTTRFDTVAGPETGWIYLDFERPVFIEHVQIIWEAACAKDYELQISDDALQWTRLKSIVGNTAKEPNPPPTGWTNAADHVGLSGVGRYLRVFATARCTIYGYSIWEMRVFGNIDVTCRR